MGDLAERLTPRTILRHRNLVSYLTVRSWRATARRGDLAAFKAEKKAKTPGVLAAAGAEMAAEVAALAGDLTGWRVACVACGHSRDPDCWGKMLARSVASALGLPFRAAFEDRLVAGSSHPKEFARLPPLKPLPGLDEPTVLVDDVATSGWHIEEALTLLRGAGAPAIAVAWIGGTIAAARDKPDTRRPNPFLAAQH